MPVDSSPLRWPAAWKDPAALSLLQATSIRQLIVEAPDIAAAARTAGFTIVSTTAPPADVVVTHGLWPGIRASRSGGDNAAAGPTGEPWVDSNGWRIRVALARRPGARVWVDAKPSPSRVSAADYILAFADVAAHGGRWIITLDDTLAAGIASKQPDFLETWKKIVDAASFFQAPAAPGLQDEAVIGVVSNFTGPKVIFTDEVLNNLARTKQQYRAILASRFAATGLKGVIYTDPEEPSGPLRKSILDFVNAGGILITGPAWGALPKAEVQRSHPRYVTRTLGQGSICTATSFSDPYLVANDAVVLVSHRYDIVRFFNSGAITPCLSQSADKRRAEVQTVFYSLRPVEDTSVWVKGSYKSAKLRAYGQAHPQNVKLEVRDAGVEVHLPAISQYAVIELES
jgi:hypothetical protein